ncbi:MAG: flagellar biosynthesis protein FlhF [Geothrix sp.]|uniref:Flagellar biosynthesis protein FlhF n=1 Tax=Candidatus Geothrix odensensis TaxID=2954440 RepID=A0A936K7F3_9BACT|nr:flagellar biosynthesis protein FlhF [Candidatus Geothrix odensensis]MBP7618678.1 flagellar biosynthesis protein FlhF [Geothrix sp.]
MRVKTFEAGSMQDALDVVKKDMGEEAFILSTRTRRRPAAMGLGEEAVIEVTAAVDEAQAGVPPVATGAPSLTYGLRAPLDVPPAHRPAREVPQAPPPAPPMDLQPLRRELLEIKGAVAELKDNDLRNASILKELDQMKALLSRIQRQGMPPAQLHLPPSLLELYGDLVANDVEPLIALRLCEYAQRALTDQEGDASMGAVDPERARLFLRRVIADFIPVAPPIQLDPGKMRVAALVGPTGVGKTTTLAKLAAYAQLHLKQKVALLTLDTYRMAAVDQLQQYAQILQVPMHVALTVEDLRSALRFYQDRALVLIDTPGHSPKDTDTLNQLRGLLDELPEVETHLVLSATTKPRDLAEIAARYEPLRPTRLLFTKLDETSTYGPILSTLARVKKPLSYLGTGQEVPEALELATSRRVADLILPLPLKEAE